MEYHPSLKLIYILSILLFVSKYSSSVFASMSGESVYKKHCVVCHGTGGEGNLSLKAPMLAAQLASYLERSLLNFKNGIRGSHPDDKLGAQMANIVTLLSEENIKQVSRWLSEQPLQADNRNEILPDNVNTRKGYNIY